MKYETHIIYTEFHQDSKLNAIQCFESMDSSWNAHMFPACSPQNLKSYEEHYNIKKIQQDKKSIHASKIASKKSCFYSHFHLWNLCIKKDLDFVVVLENDTVSDMPITLNKISNFLNKNQCVGIQLTTGSMLRNLKHYKKYTTEYESYLDGIHKIFYTHPFDKTFFAGATGYILDYKAAEYLIQKVMVHGWYQNDLMFSTEDDFPLYFITPDPIKYVPEMELNTSSYKARGI